MSGFHAFLRSRIEAGEYPTEDVLAAFLPLLRQVIATHDAGRVAPLEGLESLQVEHRAIWYPESEERAPCVRLQALRRMLRPESQGVDVVSDVHRTHDVDTGVESFQDQRVSDSDEPVTRPNWLPGFRCQEHELDHHDPLTDVFSLGQILAALACGLDLCDPDDVQRFAAHRTNLFRINRDLHPVLARVIAEMTEFDRHKRPAELPAILNTLQNYRDVAVDFDTDLARDQSLAGKDRLGRRQVILQKLQERLFEINRRNRLLHFRSTMNTVNLTQSSIPLLLDVRNVREDQLVTWNGDFRRDVLKQKAVSLNKHLNFREALYLPGTLNRLRTEALRDENEYGFAQLRLIPAFFRWADLKSNPVERYESPLLLLPVRLAVKKGIHDRYTMTALSGEAEVNPVVRHLFRRLYDISLPEHVDLSEDGIEQFFEKLRTDITASDASVKLHRIDKPRIELVREKAKRRLDHFRRRARLSGRGIRHFLDLDYSYESVNYHPLGIRIFDHFIEPADTHLKSIVSTEAPKPRYAVQHATDESDAPSVTAERQFYSVKDRVDDNPYNWEIDFCSVTLTNLKYRRMSLVRDYAALIDRNTENRAFEAAFAVTPPALPGPSEPSDIAERFHVVPCDPTQTDAITQARRGESYIIQGPPGTGKSQTITNLIADFVVRGKRVLFVCEKRAAIDVVYHRLKQQSLHELCCLIHDSQSDKKQFVMDLKATCETFEAEQGVPDNKQRDQRRRLVQTLSDAIAPLENFDRAMKRPVDGTSSTLRTLLHHLVRLKTRIPELMPRQWERIPRWGDWCRARAELREFAARLKHVQPDLVLARHPLRLLSGRVADAEHPVALVTECLELSRRYLNQIVARLEPLDMPSELTASLRQLKEAIRYAEDAHFLAEEDLLELLRTKSDKAKSYERHLKRLAKADRAIAAAKEHTQHWNDKLSSEDTRIALDLAKRLESGFGTFFKPAWWRLRKVLNRAYNFSAHAVKPAWPRILQQLDAEHDALAARYEVVSDVATEFQIHIDFDAFHDRLLALRETVREQSGPVAALHRRVVSSVGGARTIQSLAAMRQNVNDLEESLDRFLDDYESRSAEELLDELSQIQRSLDDLPDYLHCLAPVKAMPSSVAGAIRTMPLTLKQLEAAAAERSLRNIYRDDRELAAFDGTTRARSLSEIAELSARWMTVNARVVRETVRKRFLDRAAEASRPASQLNDEQKARRTIYNIGRRELDHEFGKSMRYKAIRELAAGESGTVVRNLKPVWLMSPLSVSDTLPLTDGEFDVVIFDEASQITLEDAVPAVFRAPQIIVVGDEMQLPPTSFFGSRREEDDEVLEYEEDGEQVQLDLNSTSFLNQTGRNLQSRMLGWHYRSRSESLISFSNHAFYHGRLLTVPEESLATVDRRELVVTDPEDGDAFAEDLLQRSVSFHFVEHGLYEKRRNATEAGYVAHLVRGMLERGDGQSIGIVAFSEAQQNEIERALQQLADEDSAFAERLDTERERENDGQFNGLLVKNLENIQGDERDVIILSVCYGPQSDGRVRMNFGPINMSGGEKRLNVAFSRAKHHMALVSSMRSSAITNDYNDGAACLKNYLRYAEVTSTGQSDAAETVLRSLSGRSDNMPVDEEPTDNVVDQLAEWLTADGWRVDRDIGQSHFRCDLAVYRPGDDRYRLGILVDTGRWYAQTDLLERELMKPALLQAFGWTTQVVLAQDWYRDRQRVEKELRDLLTSGDFVSP